MKLSVVLCALAALSALTQADVTLDSAVQEVEGELDSIRSLIGDLTRQVMLQQLYVEERIRTEGDSGIKVIRGSTKGFKNYNSASHVLDTAFSMHDHAHLDRTLGVGEFAVVMNGVDFRTRHSDYQLYMPSQTSTEYDAVDPVPFPGVPSSVTGKGTVEEQIAEMREWFKAFQNQDASTRDYTKYFKPVLCYVEAAWTLDESLVDSFDSVDHKLDATSWHDLQEKIRFSSYTGIKDRMENLAFLPTTIMAVNDTNGEATYAQWNYRIVCSPLKDNIDLEDLHYVDDLGHRVSNDISKDENKNSQAARFKVFDLDERFNSYNLIDHIMYNIPGKDNVPGDMTQATFGDSIMFDVGSGDAKTKLNTGFYHRWFKYDKADAMGVSTTARGFNDDNCWVAQTSQPRVAPMCIDECHRVKVSGSWKKQTVCKNVCNSFTYALPLEIVFLTPLLTWNPYKIDIQDAGVADADGQDGADKPYNGADSSHYYLTPVNFFSDTPTNTANVIDSTGTTRTVAASGTQMLLPEIEGVGQVRLRYPIAPVHGEGSSVWKELNGLRDKTLPSIEKPAA